MAHKQWEALYDLEGSAKLKDAMKRHLYRIKFGNEAINTAHEMINAYDQLFIAYILQQ